MFIAMGLIPISVRSARVRPGGCLARMTSWIFRLWKILGFNNPFIHHFKSPTWEDSAMERLFHFPLGKTTWTCSIEATRTATLLYIYIYVRLNRVLEHLGPNLMHIVRRSETIDSKTTIIIRKRHAISPQPWLVSSANGMVNSSFIWIIFPIKQ